MGKLVPGLAKDSSRETLHCYDGCYCTEERRKEEEEENLLEILKKDFKSVNLLSVRP
jgi:hypothetical protein